MSRSVAHVPTASASRYLQQLARHWSHKMSVVFSPEESTIDFPNGSRLEMYAEPGNLAVALTVPETADAEHMRQIVASHVDRFAFREAPLMFDWQPA